ncbi:MAG: hypothetical protein HY074_05830 [Deltaproteobacteria bacterium]|nr:hypothetical protein [Deltaproteobacteria bacterium]
MKPTPPVQKNDFVPELLEAALGAPATQVLCTRCQQTEYVLPLEGDNEPFDAEFISTYVCSDCEW